MRSNVDVITTNAKTIFKEHNQCYKDLYSIKDDRTEYALLFSKLESVPKLYQKQLGRLRQQIL